jgi:phosphoribosylpyrophosphate synthetase
MPHDMEARDIVIVDPMLATGTSAIAAVARLKELKSIKFVGVPADSVSRGARPKPCRQPTLTCTSTHRRGP